MHGAGGERPSSAAPRSGGRRSDLLDAVTRVQLHDLARPECRATAVRLEVGDSDTKAIELPLRYVENTEARRAGKARSDLQVLGAEELEASTARSLLEGDVDVGVGPGVEVTMVAQADDLILPGAIDNGMVRVAVVGHEEEPPPANYYFCVVSMNRYAGTTRAYPSPFGVL